MSRRNAFIGLSEAESSALGDFMRSCARHGKLRARKRAQAVYLSAQGRNVPRIAQELECSPDAVYDWLKRYREKGLDGLAEPTFTHKLTGQQIEQLMEISHWNIIVSRRSKKPEIAESHKRWTFRKIARWVKDNWGIKISHERIRQIIQQKRRE